MCFTNQHDALKSLFILHVTERNVEDAMPTFMLYNGTLLISQL